MENGLQELYIIKAKLESQLAHLGVKKEWKAHNEIQSQIDEVEGEIDDILSKGY